MTCFRSRPRVHKQLIEVLPMERTFPILVYLRVGVDYCGRLAFNEAVSEVFMASLRRFTSLLGKSNSRTVPDRSCDGGSIEFKFIPVKAQNFDGCMGGGREVHERLHA